MLIKLAEVFSKTPGARYKSEGPNSGEQFRDEILMPRYLEAQKNDEILVVDLDDCYGFATSFLEETFGGMVRKLKKRGIMKGIQVISNDDSTLLGLIKRYVKEAEEKL